MEPPRIALSADESNVRAACACGETIYAGAELDWEVLQRCVRDHLQAKHPGAAPEG